MDQVVVFQKMFEQVRKEQNFSWFYSELKHHRIAHYIYYLLRITSELLLTMIRFCY